MVQSTFTIFYLIFFRSSQSKDVVVDLPDLRRLFIGGVDSKIPFADLHLFFSKFGPVHHLQKPNDTDWLKIEFKDKLAALLCLLSKPVSSFKLYFCGTSMTT